MDSFHYIDIFSTKGFEYIVVIFFLLALIPFWRYIISPVQASIGLQTSGIRGVFNKIALSIPRGIHLDPTHTWAFLERSGIQVNWIIQLVRLDDVDWRDAVLQRDSQ